MISENSEISIHKKLILFGRHDQDPICEWKNTPEAR